MIEKTIQFIPKPIKKIINDHAYIFPFHEWFVDWNWFLEKSKNYHRILDTGFIEHHFIDKRLCKLGHNVIGIDIEKWHEPWHSNNFTYIKSDIINITKISSMHIEQVDAIISPSLIEHIGLGYYKDQKFNDNGVNYFIQYLASLIRYNGRLLIQVPYCKESKIIYKDKIPFYQTFNKEKINTLFKNNMKIINKEYAKRHGMIWTKCTEEEANKTNWSDFLTRCTIKLEICITH